MASLFSPQVDQVNLPDVTGLVSKLTSLNRTNPFTTFNERVLSPYLQGQHNIGVAEARNELLGAGSRQATLDIMDRLRARGITDTQLNDADAQGILDKNTEMDYRKAQEAHQRLSTQKMKDEMNYLAQTREADRLMAYLKEQALIRGDTANLGMANIWNSSAIQKALATNPQFRDRASEYFKANNFATTLKEIDPKIEFTNLDAEAAKLQTNLQRNVEEQELLYSEFGLAPDWNTDPKYKDKAVLMTSLTEGMNSDDAIATKEKFEKKLRDVSARLPGLPMEAKLSIVASGINRNSSLYSWLPGITSYDFSNADAVIKRIEDFSRKHDRNGQSALNQIIDYTVNNQPAIKEGGDVLANKTLQTLRDTRDAKIKSVQSSPFYTEKEKAQIIYNLMYQTEASLPTLLKNTRDAELQSKNLKVGDIQRKKQQEAYEKAVKELRAKKEKEKEIANKFTGMVDRYLDPEI